MSPESVVLIRLWQFAFTSLVSPAVTPPEELFNIPEYTVPGAYFSPLCSPALHAQNELQSVHDTRRRDPISTTSISDVNIDLDPAYLSISNPSHTAPGLVEFGSLQNLLMDSESRFGRNDAWISYSSSELDSAVGDPSFPLFSDATAVDQSPADQALPHANKQNEGSKRFANFLRQQPGGLGSATKDSSTSDTSPRKGNQSLPHAVIEDSANIVVKRRARNTLTARESRAKNIQRFNELESGPGNLKNKREQWKALTDKSPVFTNQLQSIESSHGYYQRAYPFYPLPDITGPIMSNVHSPGNQMQTAREMNMPDYRQQNMGQLLHLDHPGQQQQQNGRPFKCDQCPQSFNRRLDLSRHKRIHMAVKPFPCGHCEKSFSRKNALEVRCNPRCR